MSLLLRSLSPYFLSSPPSISSSPFNPSLTERVIYIRPPASLDTEKKKQLRTCSLNNEPEEDSGKTFCYIYWFMGGFVKGFLTAFIGILSTSTPLSLSPSSVVCAVGLDGGGHTANSALLGSLCKTPYDV